MPSEVLKVSRRCLPSVLSYRENLSGGGGEYLLPNAARVQIKLFFSPVCQTDLKKEHGNSRDVAKQSGRKEAQK